MRRACIVILTASLCGCGNPNQRKLELGVGFATRTLAAVGKNPMAAASYGSNLEGGGTVFTYLAANAPDNKDLPRFLPAPSEPWCVVIKPGPGPQDYTIEGYGTDLAKPLLTRTVAVIPGKVKSVTK